MTVYVAVFKNLGKGTVERLVYNSPPNTREQVRKAAVKDASAMGMTGYISHLWEMVDGGVADPTQAEIERWVS